MPLIIYLSIYFVIQATYNLNISSFTDDKFSKHCLMQYRNASENNENFTKFEIRTILQSNYEANLTKNNCMTENRSYNSDKNLLITIKITNNGIITKKTQYIVIDHIYDKVSKKNERLLIPYVVKIMQEPILQIYKLKFKHVVNSLPTEKVYNKNNVNGYNGCSTLETNPTCGSVKYNNEIVPYSTGFCCSCDNNDELTDNDNATDECVTNLITLPDGTDALMPNDYRYTSEFYNNNKVMVYDGIIRMKKRNHQSGTYTIY